MKGDTMKAKLGMQVTGLSADYVFFNQRTAQWLDFEPCRYSKDKFVKYVRKHFYSYYLRCLRDLSSINDDAVCNWFYHYQYEDGKTYTFIEDEVKFI